MNLQKCFDKGIHAYKRYIVTEHHHELEDYELTIEVNETTYQQKSKYGGNNHQNNFNKNRSNQQGYKNSSKYNGKRSYNSGPQVQYKFCFGSPRFAIYWMTM